MATPEHDPNDSAATSQQQLREKCDTATNQVIQKSDGYTSSERLLHKLCRKSFLSMWSYPNLYRDQGRKQAKGDGKELCDLLVVFGDHIIIFSDKECAFPNSGNLDLDWSRWYRKAVQASASQIYGAERWLRTAPEQIFLDRTCQKPFPLTFPSDRMKVHRIVVAHGAAHRCKQEFKGGSGSLMLRPSIIGTDHQKPSQDGGLPFQIGQIDPRRGFVHVLDDTSLTIVLEKLDTVSDFIAYLEKKETLITNGRLFAATGEEDLLAEYLVNINHQNEHDFIVQDASALAILEGRWENFCTNPQRLAQIESDKISYLWDALIEQFSGHILAGTSHYHTPGTTIDDRAKILRFMAAENRTRRRLLSQALIGIGEIAGPNIAARRIVVPTNEREPFYAILIFPPPSLDQEYEEYRLVRRGFLEALAMATKDKFPHATDIVAIALESFTDDKTEHSEDALYMDCRVWTEEQARTARQLRDELGLLKDVTWTTGNISEYPIVHKSTEGQVSRHKTTTTPAIKGRDRNQPCSCGSGKKSKKCCYRT